MPIQIITNLTLDIYIPPISAKQKKEKKKQDSSSYDLFLICGTNLSPVAPILTNKVEHKAVTHIYTYIRVSQTFTDIREVSSKL